MRTAGEPSADRTAIQPARGARIPWHRKLLYSFIVLAVVLGSVELLLRLVRPPLFEFVRANLASHQGTTWARSDLVPNARTRLRRVDANGHIVADFVLATDRHGMRTDDALDESETPRTIELLHEGAPRTIVHCIGDSYTLGWGLPARDAYPSQLGEYLGPEYLVLNVGVDGFGLIEASTKSEMIAEQFPPDVVCYLFCPNDFGDDNSVRQRGEVSEDDRDVARSLQRVARQSYLLCAPLVLHLWVQIQMHDEGEQPAVWALPQGDELRAMAADVSPVENETTRQLSELRRQCDERSVRLLVVILYDGQPEALPMIRYCEEINQPQLLVSLSSDTVIQSDGHFNAKGNRRLAHAVGDWILAGEDSRTEP